MHWILQNNLHREDGGIALIDFLTRMDIPFTEVKVIPLTQGLPLDQRMVPVTNLPLDQRMVPVVNPSNPVMVSGSVTLANAAADAKWRPGSFYNENHDYRVWSEHYGDHLLNADAVVCRYGDVEPRWEEFFIRPCADTKSFAGDCYDWSEFKEWQHKVLVLKECYTTLDADTMVMYSPIKTIHREARFFIVDKRVVTYSTYKIGSRVIHIQETPPSMIAFAQRMVDIWQPARAFALDVALIKDDHKIVEINCINSAGFYDIDIQKFVMAIEDMKGYD